MSGFDWSDFLDLAERLAAEGGDELLEARHRTAVSRAYYAAFNSCREWASQRGWQSSGTSRDHGSLLKWLVKNRKMFPVARDLGRLREVRNYADYDHPTPQAVVSWKDEADACLQAARRVFEAVAHRTP